MGGVVYPLDVGAIRWEGEFAIALSAHVATVRGILREGGNKDE